MLLNEDIPNGRTGYYLPSSGFIAWSDIYAVVAKALAKRGVVDSGEVAEVSQESLERAAKALGCGIELVPFQTGGM